MTGEYSPSVENSIADSQSREFRQQQLEAGTIPVSDDQ